MADKKFKPGHSAPRRPTRFINVRVSQELYDIVAAVAAKNVVSLQQVMHDALLYALENIDPNDNSAWNDPPGRKKE